MKAPFVAGLRSRPEMIVLGSPDGQGLNIRVQMPEVWDAVRMIALPSQSVGAVKAAAMAALAPRAAAERYVMKLRGYEVLDESSSLADIGAYDGSIFLLTSRRRRPVK